MVLLVISTKLSKFIAVQIIFIYKLNNFESFLSLVSFYKFKFLLPLIQLTKKAYNIIFFNLTSPYTIAYKICQLI